MPYLIGIILALAVSSYATALRLDRDGAFYPTVLIVVASYYVLFAAMGSSADVVIVETLIAAVFVVAASLGFRRGLWLVAAALAGHGAQDLFHVHLVANPGVPVWWPSFCMTYDLVAAGYLAWRITRTPASRVAARTHILVQEPRS